MALSRLSNIHHAAYRCRDAEQTRWFYEEVLELPYTMAVVEEELPGTNIPRPYMHLFFELGDQNYIAFFDDPNTANSHQFQHKDSFDYHIALETRSEVELLRWQDKLNAADVLCLGPVDHGFVKSIYFYDPNGIALEITTKPEGHEHAAHEHGKDAKQQLTEWTKRTRAQKIEIFGQDELDRRKVTNFYDY